MEYNGIIVNHPTPSRPFVSLVSICELLYARLHAARYVLVEPDPQPRWRDRTNNQRTNKHVGSQCLQVNVVLRRRDIESAKSRRLTVIVLASARHRHRLFIDESTAVYQRFGLDVLPILSVDVFSCLIKQ